MIEDRTQQATDRLLKWIEGEMLPEWVEVELRESLNYMMELHNEKIARKSLTMKQVSP
jgi:hypothetical protein